MSKNVLISLLIMELASCKKANVARAIHTRETRVTPSREEDWLIEVAYPCLDYTTLYAFDENDEYFMKESWYMLSCKNRTFSIGYLFSSCIKFSSPPSSVLC